MLWNTFVNLVIGKYFLQRFETKQFIAEHHLWPEDMWLRPRQSCCKFVSQTGNWICWSQDPDHDHTGLMMIFMMILMVILMVRFNHENVIDIRDILRSSSLDSMKDVYIVQVESPNRKIFQAKLKWKPLSPPVPDGDRLVQAAENPATKQWPHLLLPLSGFFNFLSLMGYYGLIRRRGSHVNRW